MFLAPILGDSTLFTINIGSFHWAVTVSMLVYFIIAMVIGLVAEFIVGWRLPFGFVGAFLAAIIGMWLLTQVIPLSITGDPTIYGVPIFKALIGAILLVAVWHLLTYPTWRRRRRSRYRYSRREA
ncbi:MAG: GlsB/YeaQ/YmgE family stress response membrane protein [Ktedonobacteraceae bacterium]|nr:GlsB/YeaQ/YmgE family stress response membrane protein [Chloroflexota bacterium]